MIRLVYRPNHPRANRNGMVDINLAPPDRGDGACYVISDEMAPTKHMGTGEMFTSKAKFRQRTRDIGCVEVGNETKTILKPRPRIELDRGARREAIQRTIHELRNGR